MDTICQMYIIMIRHHAVYPVLKICTRLKHIHSCRQYNKNKNKT